jgi:peptidoglycan hydrolase-like protein with peptidoglycan-binding domain
VTCLQEWLAKNPVMYPEGLVTGYFGPLTLQAVERLQTSLGIVSSGDATTTGFGMVGPRTRAGLFGTTSVSQ